MTVGERVGVRFLHFVSYLLSTLVLCGLFLLRLLEDTLNFMTKTAQHGEQASQDATGKFWKALLHKTYEIVDKVSESCKVSVRCLW